MLRKSLPYLFFFALGLFMLTGHGLLETVTTWLYGASATVGVNATGAQIEAAHQASGWVPSGTVASKFITFAGAYLLALLLPWLVQHLTHPAPTAWAKASYSTEFDKLPVAERFATNARLQLLNVIRAAAALLFAALVV